MASKVFACCWSEHSESVIPPVCTTILKQYAMQRITSAMRQVS